MSIFKTRKALRKGELRDIDVDLISLLFDDMKPANGKGAIIKADGKETVFKGSSVKYKAEEKDGEGLLYVTVYEPEVKDSQGDTASAEEIQKACSRFAKKGMLRKNDVNHNMTPVEDCYIAENYILKVSDPTHYPETKVGAWVQVIKFDDLNSSLWQKAKKGGFNGVSLFGYANDTDTRQNELESMKNELEKAIETLKQKNSDKMQPAIDELQSKLNEMQSKMAKSATDESFRALEKNFGDLITKLNKAINTSISGENAEETKEKMAKIGNTTVTVVPEKKELYKALGDIYSGDKKNILVDNLGQQFIDSVLANDDDDTLSDITVVELTKDESVDRGLISDIVLKNVKDGAAVAQNISDSDIECPTEILTGSMSLSQTTVEFYKDKTGSEAFGAYVDQTISSKIKESIKSLIFQGDRSSSNTGIKGLNGVVKLASTAESIIEIDKTEHEKYSDKLLFALGQFDNKVLRQKRNLVIYVSAKTELAMRAEFAARSTGAGDEFLLKDGQLTFQGIPIKIRDIADDHYIIALPKFIILGYRSDVDVKIEHNGADWKWYWYVRVRFGVTYVADDFVKVFQEVPVVVVVDDDDGDGDGK